MPGPFSFLPNASAGNPDNLEQLWLACGRLLFENIRCHELSPSDASQLLEADPCSKTKSFAMSCIDKAKNYDAWNELLTCREKQQQMARWKEKDPRAAAPISCHEQATTLHSYRDAFFNAIITPHVTTWARTVERAKSKCIDFRKKYLACVDQQSKDSIDCLDLELIHNDCIAQELVPVEYKTYQDCLARGSNGPCAQQRIAVRSALDGLAVDATDSIGLKMSDYARYGGPFRSFESLVDPMLYFDETKAMMERHTQKEARQ